MRSISISIARPEDLCVMKAIASRPQDLADIATVLEVHPGLDVERVRSLVRGFAETLEAPEIATRLEELLARRPAPPATKPRPRRAPPRRR